ncbi:alkaline ceramidase 3-like [Pollicipes pollicipes]|uniref:alkaline ceramidase 3-like n=1 Tax=Pollicipes pollicipes TaxID=41117 RepID=UPI0018852A52|nr:alkaline ceramidase 3-like [Pollicipes pollicipes]
MAPVAGFWGRPTSTLDWCEANYAVSGYIAEFWNTLSNMSMIVPPLYGIYEASRQRFEARFTICFILLLVVGLGSSAFHMTLLYEMQLTDELPMVFCSCFLLYCLADIQHMQTRSHFNWLSVSLVACSAIFCLSYLLYPNPLLHQAIYGMATLTITVLDVRLVRSQNDPQLWRLFYGGLVLYVTAVSLWNIDNHLCGPISQLRTRLPSFLRPFTQLHAWWHLFAGYASYIHILFCLKIWYNVRHQKCDMHVGAVGLTIRRAERPAGGDTRQAANGKRRD